MPDQAFANPRLARIYDALDPDRADLEHYVAMAEEFGARSVLDVGCGTGSLATLLSARGVNVTAIDPAAASLAVARSKPGAEGVRWLLGDATAVPADASADLAVMTGNVAQVFLDDQDWGEALSAVRAALAPGGRLVFEVRDPDARAWEEWNRELSFTRSIFGEVGEVEAWVELLDVSLPFVSFRWSYRFAADDALLTSESTLRFRPRHEIEESLSTAGFAVDEIRSAPDRPGREFVFVTQPVH